MFFFFLMIRRPPRSTLFPYTSSSDLSGNSKPAIIRSKVVFPHPLGPSRLTNSPPCTSRSKRSEEHTSELQSLTNLVCRLLLEKKKKKKSQPRHTAQTENQRSHNVQSG